MWLQINVEMLNYFFLSYFLTPVHGDSFTLREEKNGLNELSTSDD